MKDILSKTPTLRKAVATAIVRLSDADAMNSVLNKTVPKGDPLNFQELRDYWPLKKHRMLFPTAILSR